MGMPGFNMEGGGQPEANPADKVGASTASSQQTQQLSNQQKTFGFTASESGGGAQAGANTPSQVGWKSMQYFDTLKMSFGIHKEFSIFSMERPSACPTQTRIACPPLRAQPAAT